MVRQPLADRLRQSNVKSFPPYQKAKLYLDAGFSLRPIHQRATKDGEKEIICLRTRDGYPCHKHLDENGYLARHPNIVVLDCDGWGEAATVEALIVMGILPKAGVVVKSHRGTHFYYRHDGSVMAGKIGPRIDVQTKDNEIAIAGSWHPLKRGAYECDSLDFDSLETITNADLERLKARVAPEEAKSEAEAVPAVNVAGLAPMEARRKASPMAGRTDKNAQIFWWLKGAYEQGLADNLDEFLSLGKERNKQGYIGHSNRMHDADVESTCRSVWKWYRGEKGRSTHNLRAAYGGRKSGEARRTKSMGQRLEALRLRADENLPFSEIAKRVGYSKTTVQGWVREGRGSSTVLPGNNPPISSPTDGVPQEEVEGKKEDWREFMARIRPLRKVKYRGCESLKRERREMWQDYWRRLDMGTPFAWQDILDAADLHTSKLYRRIRTWVRQGDIDAVRDLESALVTRTDIDVELEAYRLEVARIEAEGPRWGGATGSAS